MDIDLNKIKIIIHNLPRNNANRKQYPDTLKKKIVGYSLTNIMSTDNLAETIGIHVGTLIRWRRKFLGQSKSLKSINQTQSFNAEKIKAVNLVLKDGLTLTEAAAKVGTTKQTLSRWIQDETGTIKSSNRNNPKFTKINKIKQPSIPKLVTTKAPSIPQQTTTITLLSTEIKTLKEQLEIKEIQLKELLFEDYMKLLI